MKNKKETKKVMPTAASVEEEKKLKALEVLRVKSDSQIDDGKATISVDGVKCLEIGDIHAIKAKQKAGKTTALKVMCGAWLNGELFHLKSELEKPVVLWLDTEQKSSDVKLIINDIKHMTGLRNSYVDKHLFLYQLRKEGYKTLLESTRLLIKKLHPQIVIADGIVDFVESFNDEQQSHR